MNITFTALSTEHQSAVMEIFNYYVQSGTAAFPAHALPEPFFAMLLKKAEGGYPACAVLDGGQGDRLLPAQRPQPVFNFLENRRLHLFPVAGIYRQGHWQAMSR